MADSMQARRVASALCVMLAVCSTGAVAAEEGAVAPAVPPAVPPIVAATMPVATGGAGIGLAMRFENSPYRDGGTRHDFVPIYVYESKRVFLEAYRVGLKLVETPESRFDVFAAYRFEGFPYDLRPASLAGMASRETGVDLGLGYRQIKPWGTLFGEVLSDAGSGSGGSELRFGYRYDWKIGKLQLQPQLTLAARDAKLNNYYYGVRPAEATAFRPAYEPGGGVNAELALSAAYRLSERWRLIGGVSATRWASTVRASPIVENRTQLAGHLGLAYDFSPQHDAWPDGRPLIVKVLYGKATDCDVAQVMLLKCTSTTTIDQTRVAGIELGRPFVERLNGWPLDFVGYVGLLRHNERGLQEDSWQANAYMKAYYYGFPWSDRVRTRLGMGVGISYAERVPYVEMRDQLARGRNSSRLLNYLDPSIDISLGDLIGVKSMGETYIGLGVTHRSGIFGTSRLLGNVNGGSNYIYSYVEWRM
ncbi:MAG: MipA/OmpV family protein [Sulfuritalea sp.]|nr:MipA/OmpV family protein [Sulfuritalea sp.]MDP1983128.1 MipA/OmpV family protein [Sulfuritalea sp.]